MIVNAIRDAGGYVVEIEDAMAVHETEPFWHGNPYDAICPKDDRRLPPGHSTPWTQGLTVNDDRLMDAE
jgi:hypothetical protein